MEFYQKLQKLRKENGMSQEELANHLGVSRQAVSKWENGQGNPETDKLLQISNLYGVSVDYLLKEENPEADGEPDDGSFYASREMVDSFLAYRWQGAKRVTLGVTVLILALVWVFIWPDDRAVIPFFLQGAIGVAILVACGFRAKRFDERMETQPLVFDANFIKEFRAGYQSTRKNAGMLIVSGILCLLLGIVFMMVMDTLRGLNDDRYGAIFFIALAGAVALILLGSMRLVAHGIIAENHKHIQELAESKATGWIMTSVMVLATAVFLLSIFTGGSESYRGMTLIGGLNAPAWVVFPIGALVGVVLTNIVKAVRKK